MAINITSPRVDELLGQLRQLTGRETTEILRDALELELERQRQLRRCEGLRHDLLPLQESAASLGKPFVDDALYDAEGLPG